MPCKHGLLCNAPGERCNDCYLIAECAECGDQWEPSEVDMENEETKCPACRGVKEGDVSDTCKCGKTLGSAYCEDCVPVFIDREDLAKLEAKLAEAERKRHMADDHGIELAAVVTDMRRQLAEAVKLLDYESRPIWSEDSPKWEEWYKKVQALKGAK